MKNPKKKLAVLRALSQEAVPVSLKEFLDKLSNDFKERTVRRWLDEMVSEGLVKKFGQKRTTKYQVSQAEDKSKTITNDCFGLESLAAIEYVNKPLYERQPTSYNEEWINSYEPNHNFYLSEELRNKLYKAGERATNKDPAGTYAHQVLNRLLIDLSYNSSRLEGNTYSLLDTERLILSGSGAEGKLDDEKVMILNHKEAIRYLVENSMRLKVDLQTICTIHYLLSEAAFKNLYKSTMIV